MNKFFLLIVTSVFMTGCSGLKWAVTETTTREPEKVSVRETTVVGEDGTSTTLRKEEPVSSSGDRIVDRTWSFGVEDANIDIARRRIINQKEAISRGMPFQEGGAGGGSSAGFGGFGGYAGGAQANFFAAANLAQQYQAMRQSMTPSGAMPSQVTSKEIADLREQVGKIKNGVKLLGDQVEILSPDSPLPTREEFDELKARVEQMQQPAASSPPAPACKPPLNCDDETETSSTPTTQVDLPAVPEIG